jgi:light-regulated signal transduction histidine kinase (bacteriophytochrome)
MLRITAADGTAHIVLVPAAPIFEGGLTPGALSIWRDVTKRASAEEVLVESVADATVTVGPKPTVMADPVQLEQVCSNFIANALKYRREGVPPAIAISAVRTGRWWEFGVADNGIGIEKEYFDRIFPMFLRLHTADEYEETGIRLAVVKKIVEHHGGRVRVGSTPGEGSTFFFTLPAT